ncbi:MAG TPA: ATP-binding protein [Gemmatimonadales bacterium]|jgi:serine/threonine-protein kinase RsbW|nr:ATP-binding protein [Gemmatimonadales bacterium]
MTSPLRLCVRRRPAGGGEGPDIIVSLSVPSDVGCIEEAVALVARHCFAGASVAERMRFRLQVALSEALANAILRGNREDATKRAAVRVELAADVIRVHVTDEGSGFDPRAVPEPLGPDGIQGAGGRGLFLIRKLVDAVEFNDRGNSICMTLRRR